MAYTNKSPDIALIDTGTDKIEPIMRVSQGWDNAKVVSYANSNLPAEKWACHSGWSQQTQASQGYRCGQLAFNCKVGDTSCVVMN